MDVYMSNELKPRNRGSVQRSADSSDKTIRENRDTVQIHDLHAIDFDMFKRAYDISSQRPI